MKIIHFADLHLGVESYGRIDPATGVSSRLMDFLAALDQVVDYAIDNRVDIVIFCGDAYKSREPSQTQQREFAKRINRLVNSDIPVFMVTGNHDLPNAIGKATAIEIFDTLSIPKVHVSNRPDVYRIETKSGVLQVASLPWLRRSGLLSREDTKNLNIQQINERMQQALNNIISRHVEELDPALPSVLAAHVGIAEAMVGSERMMAIGHEHFLMTSSIANPAFDYVALGHIHKHQVLNENPPVVYSGSLERVDFGEEKDDKGFYVVDIEPGQAERKVAYRFHPVRVRNFRTIEVDIEPEDSDPTETVLKEIRRVEKEVDSAVVRLQINLSEEAEGHLRDSEIRDALKTAWYSTVSRDVARDTRTRLGPAATGEIVPLDALKAYLEANFERSRAAILLEYGEKLMSGDGGF